MSSAATGTAQAALLRRGPGVMTNGSQNGGDRNREAAPAAAPSPKPPPPATVVRYGRMGLVGEFTHSSHLRFPFGAKVVIQTERGIELGEPIRLTCPDCQNRIPREQMLKYVEASGPEHLRLNAGRILRLATPDDINEARHLRDSEKEKMRVCEEFIERHKLPMKLVDCEHLLGGERIVFYFMSEGRIDFRDLVRDLAREFQTRIEMRQVGARDEARLIADYETCGRECCCKNYLKVLKPVNMKMAKMQKATLDPSKVSGRCGRLKCCLRYEQDTYDELERRLPRTGTRVRTRSGEGTVVDRQILTQLLLVQLDDSQRIAVPLAEVTVLEGPVARRPEGEQEARAARPAARDADDAEPAPAEPTGAARPGAPGRRPPSQDRRGGRRYRERRENDRKDRPEPDPGGTGFAPEPPATGPGPTV